MKVLAVWLESALGRKLIGLAGALSGM